MALTNKLSAIGDAIREKTGGTSLLTLDEMPALIRSIESGTGEDGVVVPDEALNMSGDISYRFRNGFLNWLLEQIGDKITTELVSGAVETFYMCRSDYVGFDINFSNTTLNGVDVSRMFSYATTPNVGALNNLRANSMASMFERTFLETLPTFNNLETSWDKGGGSYVHCANFSKMFCQADKLTEIPETLLAKLGTFASITTNPEGTTADNVKNSLYNMGFYSCQSLTKLNNLPLYQSSTVYTVRENMFDRTFTQTYNLSELTFEPNASTPGWKVSVDWANQYIDLAINVGYDGTTRSAQDSLFNLESAVKFINSLPKTTEYGGGQNTVRFNGVAGSATTGGAIENLTEEQIAVAVANGWTISLI